MTSVTPVPYDPELLPAIDAVIERVRQDGRMTPANLHRARGDGYQKTLAEWVGARPVEFEDRSIPGPAGAPDLTVSILRPADRPISGGLYHVHGGGMVVGTRFEAIDRVLSWVVDFGLVAALPDYRLAPEHPHPAPVEDCYAGLCWMSEHAREWGFDPARLVIMGGSAGGGLSAAVSLLARDRGGPGLAGQILLCPMIDDRDETVSSRQYDDDGPWNRTSNHTGWDSLLGTARGGPDVSPYAAPARATDLSGLPPAYIEVGAAELFRDEDVAYASKIWAAGGQAELHVWAGGCHGFEMVVPDAAVSRAALAARTSWLRRVLDL
ncbi:alpha/beta hydrolase [Phytoactinopolyspora limicola]|uniref:alpha/beta hydrolase n=1 Tax=Phytoactinopolyspora limicola TaxID=2715536 RepID=UPI001407FF8F|nr:alpha/beta hydrolase [Phytoactinopolyspora limicola]